MEYIAHKKDNSAGVQLLRDHLSQVSDLARKFATVFSAGDYGRYIGMLHDLGKYSEYFQYYIRGERQGKTDHSSAGAQLAYSDSKNAIGKIAAYCISGHHAGLLDGGTKYDDCNSAPTLCGRLNKQLEDYSGYQNEIKVPEKPERPDLKMVTGSEKERGNFSISFFIRMLFSCLVDADFLDTESYMLDGKTDRDYGDSLPVLKARFQYFIEDKDFLKGMEGINKYRTRILIDCIKAGKEKGDFFTLTVPTGGGKTLSSMAFAMEKAVGEDKQHIIYVIPYCSIIEQTVDTFQSIFGKENVLAAYSNVDYESENLRLATENWDKPIIVTTAVGFFESFYSNRTSKCRKLHNVANSVIIFDEVQLLPEFRLKPCIQVIKELGINYGCACVLCTATQPELNRYFENTFLNRRKVPISLKEICSNTEELYKVFRRVTYKKAGKLTDQEVAERLLKLQQVLCIVSTRKQAANIFRFLSGEGIFHLSTLMTPEHRRKILREIRERLKKEERCIVVATSLIEAGVDVDFPCVYRAETGLDSIIQAAGRCNREGKKDADESKVFVFTPEEKYKVPSALKRPIEIEKIVTADTKKIDSMKTVKRYFDILHETVDTGQVSGLDIDDIVKSFENVKECSYPFATVAEKFKMIDSTGYSVFIPEGSVGEKIAYKLQNDLFLSRAEYHYIGYHCVNIYENEFLKIRNALNMINEFSGVLIDKELYDDKTGLQCEDEKTGEAIFF